MQTVGRIGVADFSGGAAKAGERSLWSLRRKLDGLDSGAPLWRAVLSGALLGLTWGTLFRLWMRLVSDKPDFSVAGTAYLLGASILVGACAGLAFGARRRGTWKRVWIARTVAVCSFAALFFGPGMIVVPTILFATLALTRRKWHALFRALCALVALVGFGLVTRIMLNFWPPLPSVAYLTLYAAFLYPAIIAMRTGVEAAPEVKSAAATETKTLANAA